MFPATHYTVHGTSWRLTDMACCSDRARHRRADTPATVAMATPAAPPAPAIARTAATGASLDRAPRQSYSQRCHGEVAGYTKLLADSRNQARERMWREARAKGANAVVAMRFDCHEIGDIMSEIAAYGTAVTAEPIQPAPTVTALDAGRLQ